MAITYTDNGGGAPNGSDLEFTFTFPVLQTEDVKVALNNVVQATTKYAVDTASNPTKITFNNTSVDTNVQESTGAPKSGVTVRVFRQTQVGKSTGDDDPKAVYAAGSSIRATDLNANTEQALYAIHELQDQPLTDQDIEDGAITSDKIADGTIANVDVSSTAAIDGTKISPDFGSQNIATTGTINNLTTTELAILDGATVSTAELNTLDGVTASTAEINKLDGVTASTAEINKLDGVTATTAELNYVDGVTSNIQTQLDNKQPLDAELTELATMPSGTASALADLSQAEVQILDGATVSTAELNKLDGVTASTSEINLLDGVTATTAEINKLDGVTATTAEINYVDGVTSNVQTQLNNKQPLDADLTTLAGMQSGTASLLASSTALTSTTTELNQLDGKTLGETTLTNNSDTAIPTSKAVADYISTSIAPLGGFEVISNEVSFPNTQPAAGVVISISDAGGTVFGDGTGGTTAGQSLTGRTVGGSTVTINNAPSSLNGETLVAGVGLMVSSTGSSQTYNYHKILGKEDDIKQLSDDINDFNARYRVGSTNPTSALDSGDMFFNTSTGKMMVYNGTNSAWEEVQSIGNFFISTFSESFDNSRTAFTVSNAPSNAQQLIISINGVIQKPNSGTGQPSEGFTLNGSTVTFSSAIPSGSDYFVIVLGSTVNIGTPSANTVGATQLQNGQITNTHIASNAAIDASKIANLSTDSITEGNSKAEVIGSGTDDGEFKVTLQDATSSGSGETALRLYNDGGNNNVLELAPSGGTTAANSTLILNNLTTTNAWSEIQFKLSGASSGTSTIRASSGTSVAIHPTSGSGAQFQVGATSSFFQGALYTKALIPLADSTSDIGSTSVRYRNLYADTLYGDGSNLTGIASTTAGGAIYENSQTISSTHTIPVGSNGMSAGPVTINNGVSLTISNGSTYTIV